MKDTKHIRRDFHSITLDMPQGGTWGAGGAQGGQKYFFFQTWPCGISNRWG